MAYDPSKPVLTERITERYGKLLLLGRSAGYKKLCVEQRQLERFHCLVHDSVPTAGLSI